MIFDYLIIHEPHNPFCLRKLNSWVASSVIWLLKRGSLVTLSTSFSAEGFQFLDFSRGVESRERGRREERGGRSPWRGQRKGTRKDRRMRSQVLSPLLYRSGIRRLCWSELGWEWDLCWSITPHTPHPLLLSATVMLLHRDSLFFS